MSIYLKKNCFVYSDKLYEELEDHPEGHKYRVISDDDYDYVEDENLIKELDQVRAETAPYRGLYMDES